MRRRQFIQTSAAVAAAATLPRSGFAQAPMASGWDYVIVGAGTAGLPAAIFASRRGARVLLIDAADQIGGTLHMASGQISAGGSRLQEAKGIVDSPDKHYEDVMNITRGLADHDIVRSTVDRAPATINWLLDNGLTPLPDQPVTGSQPGRPAYTVPRYLWGANAGKDILAVVLKELEPELASGRVQIQLNTRVSGLILSEAGSVEGVRAEVDGRSVGWRGRHVLLTNGGYAMNPELFERLVGHPAYSAGSYPTALGDGLEIAVAAGGWLRGQELHRAGTGNILTAEAWPAKVYGRFETRPQFRMPAEVWVNNAGRRFMREDDPSTYTRTQKLLEQPRLRYAIVFDQNIFETTEPGVQGQSKQDMLEHFDTHPMFHRAESLESLANLAGVDPAGLAQSIADYNRAVAKGGGDSFGREYLPAPIVKPPFYAVIHLGSSATSSAGVAVDEELRVLHGSGKPIPNLYAAGEVLGSGVSLGDAFTPGMMLTPALSLGRWLGQKLPLG